jgi:hypothetical protein
VFVFNIEGRCFMTRQDWLSDQTLEWLLEDQDPGVRYLTLRDILCLPPDDPGLVEAKAKAHQQGPIAVIMDQMDDEGYWVEPGGGYLPKYRSSVWSLILLSQLGASIDANVQLASACQYYLDHGLTEYGQFSASGTPGGTVDCLQGNMCAALLDLGCEDDRLHLAFEWMARSLTGDGVAPMGDKSTSVRYYSGNCGPGFQCGANNKQPCAWGAAKVMLAFSKLPSEERTPLIKNAIQQGVDFLFSVDPADATYPSGFNDKPSGNWWKFGFPVFYITDILQIAEALVNLGYGKDPRLSRTLTLIREKGGLDCRWTLDYNYAGKTWVDFGQKKQPNKWVTLRAARVIKKVHHPG